MFWFTPDDLQPCQFRRNQYYSDIEFLGTLNKRNVLGLKQNNFISPLRLNSSSSLLINNNVFYFFSRASRREHKLSQTIVKQDEHNACLYHLIGHLMAFSSDYSIASMSTRSLSRRCNLSPWIIRTSFALASAYVVIIREFQQESRLLFSVSIHSFSLRK